MEWLRLCLEHGDPIGVDLRLPRQFLGRRVGGREGVVELFVVSVADNLVFEVGVEVRRVRAVGRVLHIRVAFLFGDDDEVLVDFGLGGVAAGREDVSQWSGGLDTTGLELHCLNWNRDRHLLLGLRRVALGQRNPHHCLYCCRRHSLWHCPDWWFGLRSLGRGDEEGRGVVVVLAGRELVAVCNGSVAVCDGFLGGRVVVDGVVGVVGVAGLREAADVAISGEVVLADA